VIVVLAAGAGGPAFSLELPREFDRFHLEVRDSAAGADLGAALRGGGIGWAEDEHAWVEAGQGWTRDGAVRAHVERP